MLHAIKGHGIDDIPVIVENFMDRPVTARPQAEEDDHICIPTPFIELVLLYVNHKRVAASVSLNVCVWRNGPTLWRIE